MDQAENSAPSPIRVRDSRRPGHFWADNELLDVYGKKLGVDGLAVYMALSRVANNRSGECVITLRQIGELVGCSPQTAMRAIAKLVSHNLVVVESKGTVTSRQPSVYTLLEIPRSSVPIGNSSSPGSVPSVVPPSVPPLVPIGNTYKTINTNQDNNTETPFLFGLTEVPQEVLSPTQKEKQAKEKLPDWLPMEQWLGYVDMRKKSKHPLTDYAQKLELRELIKLRGDGHDPAAVLEQSIRKSYRGLFAPNGTNGNGHQTPPEDALARERRREAERKSNVRLP